MHHTTHLRRDVAEFAGVGPHHTEGHGEGRVRAEHQLGNPHPSLWREALGRRLPQPELERRALGLVQYHDDLANVAGIVA